jgi:hypothetical protein
LRGSVCLCENLRDSVNGEIESVDCVGMRYGIPMAYRYSYSEQ